MTEDRYDYVIVGAGLAGASAVEGIRQHDSQGSILLVGAERQRPYHRPPLSKQLWTGKDTIDKIFVHDAEFYDRERAALLLDTHIVAADAGAREIRDRQGRRYRYGRLLLATGGSPRRLPIPGGDLEGLSYLRTYDDYVQLRRAADTAKTAIVIGGGFIGSEVAAALITLGLEVSMVFPAAHLVHRVFPESLALAIQGKFAEHGVHMFSGDRPLSIVRSDERFTIRTQRGRQLHADLAVVGIGITPDLTLAAQAGLQTGDGIVVNERLQTSHSDIYAAGDNAFFPYPALGKSMRVEHWDNALNQGRCAGRNMAGAAEVYDYMPFFFSDLFDFGYEAVGNVDASLATYADWQEENRTGVIYYLADGVVHGVMLCNVWEQVDAARELIRGRKRWTPATLRGAIR